MNVSNTFEDVTGGNSTSAILVYRTYAKVLTIVIVNDTTGMMTIEVGWSNGEIGHIKGEESEEK